MPSIFPQYAAEYPAHYEAGKQAATTCQNDYEHYVKVFGVEPVYGPQWIAFLDGSSQAKEQQEAAKRKAYKVDEFLVKLSALCAEHGVCIYSDYDGAFLTIKDYTTSIAVIPVPAP